MPHDCVACAGPSSYFDFVLILCTSYLLISLQSYKKKEDMSVTLIYQSMYLCS
jgi:hypothetical protein